jgi:hypothetical protein
MADVLIRKGIEFTKTTEDITVSSNQDAFIKSTEEGESRGGDNYELSLHIPNELTAKVIEETEAGKNLVHFDNKDELYKDLGI